MSNVYKCKLHGSDDCLYIEYTSENHAQAAKEYATDIAYGMLQDDKTALINEKMCVDVICEESDEKRLVKIGVIYIIKS